MSFCVAGAMDSAPCQTQAKCEAFMAVAKDEWALEEDLLHFAQARYKRQLHQRCLEVRALISQEGLHFGASDLQVC